MKRVILTKGLPASGKTTWAKKVVEENNGSYKRVSKDDLRAMLDNSKWSKNNEKFVLKIRDAIILGALEEGFHVIVDDTNLHQKHFDHIKGLVKGKANVEVENFLNVNVDTCIERDLKRKNSVGEKVIRDMYNQFLAEKIDKIKQENNFPHAVICDLDGTLAILNGRDPYDASTCEMDEVNGVVLDIINQHDFVIFVSGREEKYREQTERWLREIPIKASFSLYMRKTGDFRKDSIVKKEIFETNIHPFFYVPFVLDDRNQVVKMWRDIGLTCLQVAEGDF